jgi:hypothetical protein
MLEEFLTVVIGGHFQCDKDQRSATPTMQELKDFYMSEVVDGNEESRSINKTIKLRIAEITEGRCFFRAGNLVGHCSPATIPGESSHVDCLHTCILILIQLDLGDVVCVLLGLSQAIILRPREDSTYQVVGCAYVPGLFDGNALLPPLEPQWRVINTRNSKGNRTPSFQNPSEVSFEDPRLGPLPEGWEYVKGRKRDGTRTVTFRHLESRRKTHSDPRLSPEVLKARGIPIKTFHLA